jgi:hypothetical protein
MCILKQSSVSIFSVGKYVLREGAKSEPIRGDITLHTARTYLLSLCVPYSPTLKMEAADPCLAIIMGAMCGLVLRQYVSLCPVRATHRDPL